MAPATDRVRQPVSKAALSDALHDVLDPESIRNGAPSDAIDGIRPTLIVRPANPDQMAEALAACDVQRAAVVPRGGGTKLGFGAPPVGVDVVLDTADLTRILTHTPGDLTIAVQAGARLADVQEHLRQHGQYLPLDPPFADRATIGGLVATNASGPRRIHAGTLRDFIIGIEVACVDGRIIKSGGMVVKNVTGYDLHKGQIGALGTLGVITRVNLKVSPLPWTERTLAFGLDSAHAAEPLISAIVNQPGPLSGCDLIERVLAPNLGIDRGTWILAIRVSGTEFGVTGRLDVVSDAARDAGLGEAVSVDAAAAAVLWTNSVALAEPLPDEPCVVVRFGSLSSQVATLLDVVGSAAQSAGLRTVRSAHALAGVGRARLSGSNRPETYASAIETLREVTASLRASVVVEYAPPAIKPALDIWGPGPDAATLEVMRHIRRAFDPNRTLNPGRFLGDAT